MFVSGGTLAYGGNIERDKFSWLLIEELLRYDGPDCGRMELWLSWQEHRRRSVAELTAAREALGRYGKLHAIGEDGQRLTDPRTARDAAAYPPITDRAMKARGLTHLRRHLTEGGCARLLIGGQRKDYTGDMPGLLEEALMSLRSQQPVCLAGGSTRPHGMRSTRCAHSSARRAGRRCATA